MIRLVALFLFVLIAPAHAQKPGQTRLDFISVHLFMTKSGTLSPDVTDHGWTIMPVLVGNAACGPFDIVVTGGGRKIAKPLEVTCGE